jgi:hypothetical protein
LPNIRLELYVSAGLSLVGSGYNVVTALHRTSEEEAVDIAEGVDLNIRQQRTVIDLLYRADSFAGMRVGNLTRQEGASQTEEESESQAPSFTDACGFPYIASFTGPLTYETR